ncbi:hypothetical protein SD81_036045 [Tolypothrix campylonemoides VB511288]|nr:hypothetical protein SD81_036045 [Tolypothrix campylonemoides VB511288]
MRLKLPRRWMLSLKAQNIKLVELHIDRAYLTSHWVKQRSQDLTIFCKAWPVRNSDRFIKTDFVRLLGARSNSLS